VEVRTVERGTWMNMLEDGLILPVAHHELPRHNRACLNASLENFSTPGAFRAPPPPQTTEKQVAHFSFTASARVDSAASGRRWLRPKTAASLHHRPARRTVLSCTRRAGLSATRNVAPRHLAGAVRTRTPQVIEAPTFFGGPYGRLSTARLQTGLRPVEAPFHETSVTGLRPVGQDCSAAALEPAANPRPFDHGEHAARCFPSARERRPRQRLASARPPPDALHRDELALRVELRIVAAPTISSARRLPPMLSTTMARAETLRRSAPPARAANRPQLHSPRGPSRPPDPSRTSSPSPEKPGLLRWTRSSASAINRPSRYDEAPMGKLRMATQRLFIERPLFAADGARRCHSLPPNKPLHPTALRAAGERQGVGRVPVMLSGGRG
jgi:hypothetical protein